MNPVVEFVTRVLVALAPWLAAWLVTATPIAVLYATSGVNPAWALLWGWLGVLGVAGYALALWVMKRTGAAS
jgi:predicted PurR-regulated permease PerM